MLSGLERPGHAGCSATSPPVPRLAGHALPCHPAGSIAILGPPKRTGGSTDRSPCRRLGLLALVAILTVLGPVPATQAHPAPQATALDQNIVVRIASPRPWDTCSVPPGGYEVVVWVSSL